MVLSEGLKKVHPYHALEVVRYSGGGGGCEMGTGSIHCFPMYPWAIMFTPIVIC